MSSLQLRLTALLAGLVAAVVVVTGLLAERGLRAREVERVAGTLRERAAWVRERVAGLPLASPTRELRALAESAAGAAGARVTLIDANGTVVADSDVPPAALLTLENHATRPEVRTALEGGTGLASRRSATVGLRFLYLATPVAGPGSGVVRLAADLGEVDAAVSSLRWTLLAAASLGMVAAVALAYALASFTLRPLRRLEAAVSDIAEGQLERRAPWHERGEIGRIAAAINRIAATLRARPDDATAEKERLAAVLASMGEGVLVLDASGRILLANPRLRELLGLRGAVEGRIPLEVIRHAELDRVLRLAASEGPVVREIEVVGLRPVTLLVHAVGFPPEGDRLGTVAVFHDTTELHRLESVRREFVATVSHELKTPLTAIRGYAETLTSGNVPAGQAASFLEVILRHAERLGTLIDDVLELSRIESRKPQLAPTGIELGTLVRELIQDLEPRLGEKQLTVDTVQEGPAIARADRRSLERILLNLLDNAIKYTDRNGNIRVRLRVEDPWVRVEVEDTGIGIPRRDLPRIFERFYRVDAARSRDLGGTGLGLSIVKHLVQAQGGHVFVDSEVGKGTRIVFTVPRGRIEELSG